MRDIEFRARKPGTTEFVYGFYFRSVKDGKHYISPLFGLEPIEIDPKTLGQYIGRKDKENTKIYEGDVVRHFNGEHAVTYDEHTYSFQMELSTFVLDQEVGCDEKDILVIGNTCDNKVPEKKEEPAPAATPIVVTGQATPNVPIVVEPTVAPVTDETPTKPQEEPK